VGMCGLDSPASVHGPVAGSCEHGNEPSGSIKRREFLDWLGDSLLIKTLLRAFSSLINVKNDYK
jgi:hypothetical protein